jgi:hypothetical protein
MQGGLAGNLMIMAYRLDYACEVLALMAQNKIGEIAIC